MKLRFSLVTLGLIGILTGQVEGVFAQNATSSETCYYIQDQASQIEAIMAEHNSSVLVRLDVSSRSGGGGTLSLFKFNETTQRAERCVFSRVGTGRDVVLGSGLSIVGHYTTPSIGPSGYPLADVSSFYGEPEGTSYSFLHIQVASSLRSGTAACIALPPSEYNRVADHIDRAQGNGEEVPLFVNHID